MNKLDQEVLGLYIKLQPKIREVMGEIKRGEMYWCKDNHRFHNGLGVCGVHETGDLPCCGQAIWLPPPINTFKPGSRDLWGMVDWTRWCIKLYPNGKIEFRDNYFLQIIETPTLALLKAIAAQKGVL